MMIAFAMSMNASTTAVRRSVQTWIFVKPKLCHELVFGCRMARLRVLSGQSRS